MSQTCTFVFIVHSLMCLPLLVQKCQLNKLSMFHVDESSEIVMSNKNVSMHSNHVDILRQCLDVRWVWIYVYCVCNASEIYDARWLVKVIPPDLVQTTINVDVILPAVTGLV